MVISLIGRGDHHYDILNEGNVVGSVVTDYKVRIQLNNGRYMCMTDRRVKHIIDRIKELIK